MHIKKKLLYIETDVSIIAEGNVAAHGLNVAADAAMLAEMSLVSKEDVALFKRIYAGLAWDSHNWFTEPYACELLQSLGKTKFMSSTTLESVLAEYDASKRAEQLFNDSVNEIFTLPVAGC